MAHAVKCPICYGTGKVGCNRNGTYPEPTEICNGCAGKGWIEVADAMPVGNWPWITPLSTEKEILGH